MYTLLHSASHIGVHTACTLNISGLDIGNTGSMSWFGIAFATSTRSTWGFCTAAARTPCITLLAFVRGSMLRVWYYRYS